MFRKMMFMIAICIVFLPAFTHAGWVDDWIDQKTENSPGYFEGQKRGYFNGGSFSARWYNSNDYLASLNPPRVKTGCGGIDVFGGAVSFMNAEYLVQKLQAMLVDAPAVAFDIAFNTLCEPCAKSMKSFQAITDTLNQLQFSDCQASQVLVAKTFQGLGSENAKVRAMAESDFALTRGVQDLRTGLTNIWKSNDNQQTVNDNAQIAGCPAGIREVFATPGQTVLSAMAQKKGYFLEYIDLARGFTGDILILEAVSENGTRQIFPLFIPPCEQNKPEAVENFLSGQAYRRPADGSSCTLIDDANANLSLWANNKFNGIVTRMRNGVSLSIEEETFINTLPLPAYSALKIAVLSDQPGSIIGLLSNMTARAYAYSVMSDLYNMALQNIVTAQSLISAQGQQTKSDCQMDLMAPAITQTEELAKRIQESVGVIQRAYAATASEVNTILEVSMRFEQFNRTARSQLSEAFGPSLVNRAMGSN